MRNIELLLKIIGYVQYLHAKIEKKKFDLDRKENATDVDCSNELANCVAKLHHKIDIGN